MREVVSLAALGSACIAVRVFSTPAGDWLAEAANIDPVAATVLAGVGIGVGALTIVAIIGRVARRGVHAAGLGAIDRLAGGALGTAEGTLIAALLLLAAVFTLGRDDPLIADSRSLAAFEELESWVASSPQLPGLPDVASPPSS